MTGCGVAEGGRVDRRRLGQAALPGGLADIGHEVLESRWHGDLQDMERLVRPDDEGVRQPGGQQDEAAGAGGEVLSAAVEAGGARQPALLRQVLDQALAGDDEPLPVAQRPWFRPVWDASTPPAVLDAYAGVCTLISSRAARIFEVVRRAADQAPEIAQLWDTLQRNRRAGARMVIEHAVSLGPLAAGLDIDHATDILWIFNDPAHYDTLVSHRGWPEPGYTRWLSSQIRHALLPAGSSADHDLPLDNERH
jgi:hypothetical protein